MARPRLTKEAIAFIIECRDDPTQINTWKDIAKMVHERFGVEISLQAIQQNYSKYKDEQIAISVDKRVKNHSKVTQTSKPIIREQKERNEFTQSSDEEFQKILKGE